MCEGERKMKVRTKEKEKNGHMKYHRGSNINIDTSMNFDCEETKERSNIFTMQKQ